MESSEKNDVSGLAIGDVTAFNRIYERYHKRIHANILKFIRHDDASFEILQDVFLSLWQNRFKFESSETAGNWLFVVSYNKSLNKLRSELKHSIDYVAEFSQEQSYYVDEETDDVQEKRLALIEDAINILPARKKQVFMMCRYEGKSKDDVAAILGISRQSVSDYLKQANKAIKSYVLQRYDAQVPYILLLSVFLQS